MRESGCGGCENRADVVHQMRGTFRLLDDPPYAECNGRPCEDRLEVHSASLEAQTSRPLPVSLYPSPKTGLDGGPSRRGPRAILRSAAVCPEHRGATHAPGREYAAPRGSVPPMSADRKQPRRRAPGKRAGQPVLCRIVPATHTCISTFCFLDVPRSDNIPPCRACLGHGDA